MLDSIFIGTSGLQGFSKGLKVISNNVANLNTPGFKASVIQFADMYYQSEMGGAYSQTQGQAQFGTGLTTLGTSINFQAGETRQTGNPLDMSVNGEGYFVTRDPKNGTLNYSRAGQFEFDQEGLLVSRSTGFQVMGYAASGAPGAITLSGLRVSQPRPTSRLGFAGNLSSTATDFAINSVNVVDAAGGSHALSLAFVRGTDPGEWTVTVSEGATTVGTGEISFAGTGEPIAGASAITFSYSPAGSPPSSITLDFAEDVTSFSSGTTSTLAVSDNDGYPVGQIAQVSFDAEGAMEITYTNGQEASGAQLQLALFDNNIGLEQAGAGQFISNAPDRVRLGRAGADGFGSIAANQIEVSNVDLSAEFSDLIVMQRGYQASSRIVSTASEMLQELFDLQGKR